MLAYLMLDQWCASRRETLHLKCVNEADMGFPLERGAGSSPRNIGFTRSMVSTFCCCLHMNVAVFRTCRFGPACELTLSIDDLVVSDTYENRCETM